ncbi:hypothetical protein HS088_TW06G00222 [Tripterygium wilfordii]|uniref:Uncharacterized protein n=1 Tax=Tripterygium wilfordii TaxID=458696 RepID=A0A7J7DI85_TRIWF|nr:vascular-related unknown protein 4-like [Tripterygium wilfordii]KAF5746057.1 hypothetical protein HS088_TW06G00222 [Tripterygium wilfordii]
MEEESSSMNSSISKDVVSSKRITHNSCEESGWTAYFEDLSDDHQHSNFSSSNSLGSSSMVSDASSRPALLKSCKEHGVDNVPYSSMPKKLNFKKSRAKEISHVDLEDTASSPVNSPKVSDPRPADSMNPRKADDHNMCSSLGKGGTSEEFSGLQEGTTCETNNGYKNLKKKGLCLVPMSFLFNYLG